MATIDHGRLSTDISLASLCLLLIAGVTGFAIAPTSAAQAGAAQSQQEVTGNSVGSETRTTIRRSDGDYSLEVTALGDLEFTDDDADVKSIPAGSRLLIKARRGGDVRTLEVVRGADGRPRYSYFAQGRASAFDQEARAWLARILPGVVRGSGINAAARVRRILDRRGVDGVLEEIRLIESDGIQRIYFDELLKDGRAEGPALGGIVRSAARELASDGEKANLLIAHVGRLTGDSTSAPNFFEAADTIKSDGERARVLSSVLKRNDTPRAVLLRLFQSAARIASDGEKANVLVTAAPLTGDDQTLIAALHDAARTISSDAERQRVILALAQRGATSQGRS